MYNSWNKCFAKITLSLTKKRFGLYWALGIGEVCFVSKLCIILSFYFCFSEINLFMSLMSHESMSQWVRGVFSIFSLFISFFTFFHIFSTIWLILWQILTVNFNLFRTWRLCQHDHKFEICRIHSTIWILFSIIWCLFLEVKHLTTEDDLPPISGYANNNNIYFRTTTL